MRSRDTRDILGGVLLIMAGLFFALYARQYAFGEAARMGPGYLPTVLGWLLAALGIVILLPALRRPGPALDIRWKSLLLVVASIVFFAFTLPPLGLVPAVMGTVFLASLADNELTWRTRAIVSAAVPLLMVAIFIGGLDMQLRAFWW